MSERDAPLFALDFDALEQGKRFSTDARRITESDVSSFAQLTGDLHPQHVDAEWAAGSAFGQRIAHGMLVLSHAVGLVPLDPERVIALRRLDEVVFKQPAYFEDMIHVEGTVDSLKPIDDSVGIVGTTWKVLNQDGRTLVRARVQVLWRRSGARESAAEEQRSGTSEPSGATEPSGTGTTEPVPL